MRTWAAAALAGGPPPPPPPPVTPVAPDTIGDRIAEAEAAADELRRALADADAATKAWAESEAALQAKVDAARDRVARASAGLTAGLAKVGPAYRKDKEGEGMSVYLPDGDGKGKVKTIRPVAPTTAVPAQSK
jgi:type IV secretory pathway VirB10-like protein